MCGNTKENRDIVFISSRQDELQAERDALRNLINNDEQLSKLFIAITLERDFSGRRESVNVLMEDRALRSNVYLGIFDEEYSEVVEKEYDIAISDKLLKKEIIALVRKREREEREKELNRFLDDKIMHPSKGHSCKTYSDLTNLLEEAKKALLDYVCRKREGFLISEEVMGKNLEQARYTDFPEKVRRGLFQPIGRCLGKRGRGGVVESYRFNENGEKIDITWEVIKDRPDIPDDVKEYYSGRYRRVIS